MKNVRSWPIITAFIVAPMGAAVMMAILTPVADKFDFLSMIGLIPIFYFFAAAPSFAIGIPLYLVLNYYRRLSLLTILLGGTAIAFLSAYVIRFPDMAALRDVLVSTAIGVISSLLFWFVWRYHYMK